MPWLAASARCSRTTRVGWWERRLFLSWRAVLSVLERDGWVVARKNERRHLKTDDLARLEASAIWGDDE